MYSGMNGANELGWKIEVDVLLPWGCAEVGGSENYNSCYSYCEIDRGLCSVVFELAAEQPA